MVGIVVHDQDSFASIGGDSEGDVMLVAGHRQCLPETADPVPAHLSPAAIGIPELHHDIDGLTAGGQLSSSRTCTDDEAIGTESASTIAERTSERCIAVQRTVNLLECDEEIVAETVVLGESH
jgi:hypothetical protein